MLYGRYRGRQGLAGELHKTKLKQPTGYLVNASSSNEIPTPPSHLELIFSFFQLITLTEGLIAAPNCIRLTLPHTRSFQYEALIAIKGQ